MSVTLSNISVFNNMNFWDCFISITGIVVGIISIVVTIIGIFGTISSIRKPIPKYTIHFPRMKTKGVAETKNLSNNKQVTVSKIAIWNSGKTLFQKDIIIKAPISIKATDDASILDCELVYSEEKNNIRNIVISKDCKSITFDFDLLRNNEGFVLKVTHSGNRNHIIIEGSLVEGGEIVDIPPYTRIKSWLVMALGLFLDSAYISFFVLRLAGFGTEVLHSYPKSLLVIMEFSFAILIFLAFKHFVATGFSSISIPKTISCWLFNEEVVKKNKSKFLYNRPFLWLNKISKKLFVENAGKNQENQR